jgi:hypothetical protein
MRAQIVHHQNGIRPRAVEGRQLFQIGQQLRRGGGHFNAHGGNETVTRQHAQNRQLLPHTNRSGSMRSLFGDRGGADLEAAGALSPVAVAALTGDKDTLSKISGIAIGQRSPSLPYGGQRTVHPNGFKPGTEKR